MVVLEKDHQLPNDEKQKRILISPSIFAADFSNLEREVARVPSADWIHVDIMDGIFVPNFSMGYPQIKALKKHTEQPLDVHLMIRQPVRYIQQFADAGSDVITIHLESDSPENTRKALELVRKAGKKAGLAISPDTPADLLLPYMKYCDLILVMTIYPGIPGQKLIRETLQKVQQVRRYIDYLKRPCFLETDGGINPGNIADVVEAGADVLVSGGAVFENKDADGAVRELKKIGEKEYELCNWSRSGNKRNKNDPGE